MPAAVAVAASGGRDSTALLHATARAARELGVEVHALHVHHGLVASADTWLAQLRAQCARWARSGLPLHFHATRLAGAPARGESVEAWARRERYAALAAMAQAAGCDLVLLAQHRRDQAETLLLQALRGGGAEALAVMPRRAERDGLVWARPWLDRPREEIEAYLRRHRLRWVDDESNDDEAFSRNRLRRQVWPALLAAFPEAEQQLAASARRAAEAAAALRVLADTELVALSDGDGALDVAGWRRLPETYRAPVLRRWLQSVLARPVPESLVRRLADELPAVACARWPAPGGELRLHDARLVYVPPQAAEAVAPESVALDLSSPRFVELPSWGGVLEVKAVAEGGVSPSWLRAAELRARQGGESFQAAPRATPRALKKQFQARRVAAWDRAGPLVFSGEQLVFVPGLGIDARCRAAAGEAQLALFWRPA
ncbi:MULTISPECIES: tRNA lysidine(34) synthetase TilS [unclassified Rubrivivax]|uniref:tRNA lysidine(34) synthetase TilS n=1 Tax=unclassified Rubrivivax TaxID=2649762 RepID=UPI001E5B0FAD|nr:MULTISPECIES: tRNA lysidine(34) synthetase TilS [unclassified Rubrivivax]MCC9597891.1 tRNA lysidine(34) synthetase TilS [Rubrivivax sp. JA1055]MCC9645852.1 tRNA lysidine(34) synthetase TilS [Rubrivivax sp. JA1029]